ncbi:DUF3089 domain-containing protein [Phenylobacterium sp.]|uniref:DUF3089 domain-containing protein n=1 Tax=Phenylobacterium sp. TaxID=1871053 RepID=UPI0035B3F4B7
MRTRRLGVALAIALTPLAGPLQAEPLGLGMIARTPPSFGGAPPPSPDYKDPAAWAARPETADGADVTPPDAGAVNRQATARVDVFFIHPTTYLSSDSWNAPFDASGRTGRQVDEGVLRFQASAFNGAGRVFAPRYRQASITAFTHPGADSEAAIDLAYQDVRRAFDAYIAHDNHGRPFILAGHSQGSLHAMRLLQERIAGTALQRQLVAAYLVGSSLPEAIEQAGIPICRQPAQTGCVINWNSVRAGAGDARRRGQALIWLEGRYQPIGGRPLVCVNPLSWRKDGEAPAALNLGALPVHGPGQPLEHPKPGLTGARCRDGLTEVTIPLRERAGFSDALTRIGSYHVFDYNLFYMNVRQNAELRTAAYLRRQAAGSGGP